jgi:hypothetical protein
LEKEELGLTADFVDDDVVAVLEEKKDEERRREREVCQGSRRGF